MKEPTKTPASGTDVWPIESRLAKSKTLLDVSFDNGKILAFGRIIAGGVPLS